MAKSDKVRGTTKPASKSAAIPTVTSSSNARRKSPPVAKAPLSSEYVKDSSDDDEPSANPTRTKAAPVKKKSSEKKVKAKVAVVEVSSDSESSSEESDESSSQASKSDEKITKGMAKNDSDSGSESGNKENDDSSNEETDSSSSSTPPLSKGKGPSSDSRQQQVRPPTSHVSETRPAPTFQPPHGFKSVNTSPTTSKTADLFQSQNTSQKQIWYITAPANVPLSSLKELALEKLVEGESVMSHKDVDYSFMTDETARLTTSIIVPTAKGFQAIPTQVSKVVHLRQIVKLPTAPQSREGISSASLETLPQPNANTRPKREQPKGLKMFFRPSGTGTGDIGSIGESDSDESAASRPTITATSKKRKERDEDSVSGEKKKKKKDKHREGQSNGDEMTGITVSGTPKKSKASNSDFSAIKPSPKVNGDTESTTKKDKEKKKKKRDKERA